MEEKNNPLGYHKGGRLWSKQARVCLPCFEREKFIQELVSRKLEKVSIRSYNRYIDEFHRYIQSKFHITEIKSITTEMIESYLTHLDKDSLAISTNRSPKASHVKKWYEWMVEIQILNYNPFPVERI